MSEDTRRYLESHEWALLEGDVVTLGLSEFAVKHLSDLVFIQLPEVGDTVDAGETFGEIESVKAVSDLTSPVTGEVVEINEAVVENLELISSDSLGDGWLIKVRISDNTDYESLLDFEEYSRLLEDEEDEDDLTDGDDDSSDD